jgi:guanylate kinase
MDSVLSRRGVMLILSSPSGAGKTTISRALIKQNNNMVMSVSATTRPRRAGEVHGQDYFFITADEFRRKIDSGEMMEHARVFDHFYGTPRGPVETALRAGKDVVFDIDWQGTQQLCELAREDVVSVFILPPSRQELEKRLRHRSRDTRESDADIRKRMSKAADEISHYAEYDYVIINSDIEHAIAQAQSILDGERLKRQRIQGLSDFVRGLMAGL